MTWIRALQTHAFAPSAVMLTLVALCSYLASTGCSAVLGCSLGEVQCWGDGVAECTSEHTGHSWSVYETCGEGTCAETDSGPACVPRTECDAELVELCGERHCVEVGASAFCALGAEPDPLCQGGSGSHCEGGRLVECRRGHRVTERQCAVACVDSEGGVACVQDDCEDVSFSNRGGNESLSTRTGDGCLGSARVVCKNGSRRSTTPCDGGVCVLTSEGAECALSATPHPNCPEKGEATACDGDNLASCVGGFVVDERPCDVTCGELAGGAACVLSADVDERCPSGARVGVCDGSLRLSCASNGAPGAPKAPTERTVERDAKPYSDRKNPTVIV